MIQIHSLLGNYSPTFEVEKQFSSILSNKGNGEFYDGKPEDRFYRYIPGYQCNHLDSSFRMAEVQNQNLILYEFAGETCATQTATLPITSLMLSPFQSEFLAVNDFLFKKYESTPSGIPDNLAELLCRDNFANPKIELFAHFDREKNQAQARLYSSKEFATDFPVSRLLSMNEVRYISEHLAIQVNFSKVIEGQRRYRGRIESSSLAAAPVQDLTCVIGGSLDTSKWNSKLSRH